MRACKRGGAHGSFGRSVRSSSVDFSHAATAPAGGPTIPLGQRFILQLETAIHTRTTRSGDRVEFSTAADVLVDNQILIPNQSWVRATVTRAKRAGRLFGRAEVHLRFDEVRLADGTVVPLKATITRVGFDPVNDAQGGDPRIKGEAGKTGSIGQVAQGGLQGVLIGVMTAGAKGAMYGGAAGAAITLAGMVLRRGPDVDLPRATMFEAKFDQPLDISGAAVQSAALTTQSRPASAEIPSEVKAPSKQMTEAARVWREPQPPPAVPAAAPPAETVSSADASSKPPDTGNPPELARPPVRGAAGAIPAAATASGAAPTPSAAEAQPDGVGGVKLTVNVRMVLVDAVVRDRAGRMIDNLSRNDFRLYEDGVEQEIRHFSRDELPLAVALVIDRSGSVAPYISELRRIAARALEQFKPQDQVALFSFAHTVERVEDLTTDRERIARGIDRVRAGGGTDIIDALYDSVTYLAKTAPELRHAVILISDNQPTVRPAASEGETIKTAMETETVVYSVKTSGQLPALASRLPSLLMGGGSVSKVTEETGGEIIDARTVGSLDAALGSIISRLRMRYSLGYYPSASGQGMFHTIVVRLAEGLGKPGSEYFLHARRGYYSTGKRSQPRNP